MGREKGRTNCRRHYSPINCSTSHKFSFRFINRHNGPHMHRLLYLNFDFPPRNRESNIFIFNCLLLAVATHKRGVWTNSRIWSNRKLWTNRFTGDSIFELVRPSALYSGVAFWVERLSSLLCEWFICFNCFHNIWGIKYTNISNNPIESSIYNWSTLDILLYTYSSPYPRPHTLHQYRHSTNESFDIPIENFPMLFRVCVRIRLLFHSHTTTQR